MNGVNGVNDEVGGEGRTPPTAPDGSCMHRRRGTITAAVVAAVIVVLATIGATWFTTSMILATDSVGYLGAAHNIDHGAGLTTPFALLTERSSPARQVANGARTPYVEQPPAYPATLAFTQSVGSSPLDGARIVSVLGILALAVSSLGIGLAAFGPSPLLLCTTALLVVVTPAQGFAGPMVESPYVMSERLFIPMALVTLLAITIRPLHRGTRAFVATRGLVALVGLVALTTLTRYTGAAVAIAGAVVLGLDATLPLRRRVSQVLLFVMTPVCCLLLISLVGGGAPKVVAWHPSPILEPAMVEIARGLRLPGDSSWLRNLLVVAIVVLPLASIAHRSLRSWRSTGQIAPRSRDRLALALAAFELTYAGILVVTMLALDALVGLDQRTMSPLIITIALLAFIESVAWTEIGSSRHPSLRHGPLVAGVLVLAIMAPKLADLPSTHDLVGRFSEAQRKAMADPPLTKVDSDTIVFATEPGAIWYGSGLTVHLAPNAIELTTGAAVTDLDTRTDQMVTILRSDEGLVVIDDLRNRWMVDDDTRRGLDIVATCEGLTILGVAGSLHAVQAAAPTCPAARP